MASFDDTVGGETNYLHNFAINMRLLIDRFEETETGNAHIEYLESIRINTVKLEDYAIKCQLDATQNFEKKKESQNSGKISEKWKQTVSCLEGFEEFVEMFDNDVNLPVAIKNKSKSHAKDTDKDKGSDDDDSSDESSSNSSMPDLCARHEDSSDDDDSLSSGSSDSSSSLSSSSSSKKEKEKEI